MKLQNIDRAKGNVEKLRCNETRGHERRHILFWVSREGAMHLRAAGSRSYSSCAGLAESFVQNRACTYPGRASASNPMTVAAASATLVAHFGCPRRTSAAFGCIPRASTRETALEKRRVQCPILREDARRARTAAQGQDEESREKDWKWPRRSERAAEEEMRDRGSRHSVMPKGCARWRSRTSVYQIGANITWRRYPY